MSPELRIEKKSSHYYDDGDLDNRYKKSHDIDLDELAWKIRGNRLKQTHTHTQLQLWDLYNKY